MDEQTAAGSVGAGGTEVALYVKGTERLCAQPLPLWIYPRTEISSLFSICDYRS